jgi:hypothetical protein
MRIHLPSIVFAALAAIFFGTTLHLVATLKEERFIAELTSGRAIDREIRGYQEELNLRGDLDFYKRQLLRCLEEGILVK